MRYCQRCVMPDTRPGSQIDEKGICLACRNYDRRATVDWDARWHELELLCGQYRNPNRYDCVIAVSGGKDSHFLVYTLKERLHMNPLLIRVKDAFSNTIAGTANVKNIATAFDCDMIEFGISPVLYKQLTRYCFEKHANFPFIDGEVYTTPVNIASKYDIPLVFYGENPAFEFGSSSSDVSSAIKHVTEQFTNLNNLLKESGLVSCAPPWLRVHGDPYFIDQYPPVEFMSYYVPWSGYNNYQIAKQWGFRDLHNEWQRLGCLPQDFYEQIDIVGWQVSSFLKYIKLGFGRATDIACRWIREGRMSREDAVKLINECDGRLDQRELDDFLSLTGYTTKEFYEIADKWYNKNIFEKVNGVWRKREECKIK